MLKDSIQKALNEQINEEAYSSYLYYSMSAYCQANDLRGMANWFKVQAQEELIHVSKFFDYILDRDGKVTLMPIRGPETEWASPLAAFEASLKHERHITECISKLVELAQQEKDFSTYNFLQWFVSEQVEEEASVSEAVGQLKLAGSSGSGLFMIDRELGARTFVMPPATGASGA